MSRDTDRGAERIICLQGPSVLLFSSMFMLCVGGHRTEHMSMMGSLRQRDNSFVELVGGSVHSRGPLYLAWALWTQQVLE